MRGRALSVRGIAVIAFLAVWLCVAFGLATPQVAGAVGSAAISGRVTDQAGMPLSDIWVTPVLVVSEDEWIYGDGVTTGEDGRYTIAGLDAGEYVLRFEGSPDYVSMYLGGSVDYREATRITLGSGGLWSAADIALPRGARLSGRVTGPTGEPVAGAWVNASRVDAQGYSQGGEAGETDASGRYEVTGLVAGSYRVEFSGGEDFISEYWQDAQDSESARLVPIGAGQVLTGFDASLVRGAKVSGRLLGPSGGPAPDVYVRVERLEDGRWQWAAGSNSRDDGTYVVGGLRAGRYRVLFDGTGATAREYWNGKSTGGSAAAITLASGQVQSGVDARLKSPASLSGRVTDAGGSPLAGQWVYVTLCDTVASQWEFVDAIRTGTDGRYSATGLAPGRYRIQFTGGSGYVGEYWDNALAAATAKSIVLAVGQQRSDVNAALSRGGSLSGRITDSTGAPLSGVSVWANRLTTSTDRQYWSGSATTNSDGAYEIAGLIAGRYNIQFGSTWTDEPQAYATEYWADQVVRSLATPVEIASGQSRGGLDARLDAGATISGRVRKADGSAAAGVGVYAWRKASAESWVFVAGTSAQASGQYVLSGLPAGTYRVEFASNGSLMGEFWSGARQASSALSVQVAAGQSVAAIDGTMRARAKASVGMPSVRLRGRTATVRGALKPAHAGTVSIQIYRGTGCDLVFLKSVAVKCSSTGTFSKAVSLSPGTYVFRAAHADTAHAYVESAATKAIVVR